MIEDLERPRDLERAWESRARDALEWREGEPIAAVLEALALSVALEVLGALGDVPRRAREDLARVGRRALLHAAAPPIASDDPEEQEDAAEAHRLVLVLARDGLRALSSRPLHDEDVPRAARRPTARDLARLLSGRLDAYEAATIARALRAWPDARAELAWALRRGRGAGVAPLTLAAAEGELMRDPAGGTQIATVCEPGSGAAIAEIYAFPGASLAAYAAAAAPLRVEGPGVRTEAMQPGYWAGAIEGDGLPKRRELAIYVGEARYTVVVALD